MADTKQKKRAKDRKNPGMRDKYQAERKAKNALRLKQCWVGGESIAKGGHWEGR
jgi:hypothetical protein